MFNIELEDMYNAYVDCRKRKKNKKGAKQFELCAMYNVMKIVEEINAGKYKLKPSSCFIIEYPKPREVFCAAFRDRVVQHFVYNELNPVIEKMLISDTASCRKGKGTDYAIQRAARFLRRETDNYSCSAYILKMDLSGFFMNIDRDLLLEKVIDIIWNKYSGKYKEVLDYLVRIIIKTDITKNAMKMCNPDKWNMLPPEKTLFGNKYGLAIGNITSQLFANLYLSDMDHFLKSRHSSCIRYVDDIIVIDKSKEKLQETFELVGKFLKRYHQSLNKNKSTITSSVFGVTFLGVRIKPHYNSLSKSRINRLYYTTNLIETREKFLVSAASRKGMFERYKGYNLYKRWISSVPPKFKEDALFCYNYKVVDKRKSKVDELINISLGGQLCTE